MKREYKKPEKAKEKRPKTGKISLKGIDLSVLKGEEVKIATALLFGGLSIYLLISFISFFIYGGMDCHVAGKGFYEIIDVNVTAKNWGGPLGAKIAEYLINQCVGVSAIIICYILAVIGVRILVKSFDKYLKHITVCVAMIIWISLFLGFISEKITQLTNADTGYLFLGGAHGYYVSIWLDALIGSAGTFLIIVLSFVLLVYFGFRSVFYRCVEAAKASWQARQERKAAQAIAKAEEEERRIIEEKKKQIEEAENEQQTDSEENTTDAEESDSDEISDNDDTQEDIIAQTEKEEEEIDAFETSIKNKDFELDVKIESEENSPQNEIEFEVNKIVEDEKTTENQPVYDPTLDLSRYKYPTLDLLADFSNNNSIVTDDELEANKQKIVETLQNYKIDIVKIQATIGPTVTLYEIVPAPGVKIAKIKNLEDDIALSLRALGIRIIAPIPGQGTVGIEVPNRNPQIVPMKALIASKRFQESKFALPVVIGRTISNEPFAFDLAKMPHMLVAGATGQGKSVGLNAIITSLLYKKHPAQLKFVMIDPKKVELSIYSIIEKHFLAKLPDADKPIITDTDKVVNTLNSLCIEMDNRYSLLEKAYCRTVKEYNEKFSKHQLNPNNGHRYLPYIVVIVDEFADLIMTAGKEVEKPICRIAQLARAVGIHMIIATQRPSTNIITGTIKANFPARIAFKVAQMVDSRTILDAPGANQLIGRGDMLISVGNEVTRVQCAFVDTPEVEAITKYIASQQGYPSAYELPEYVAEKGEAEDFPMGGSGEYDKMFEECARFVVGCQQGSTSALQRRFGIGFNRAGRIMDQLEAAGIVGAASGSKPRNVLMDEYSLEKLLNEL